jgi:CspA family cold shock protein
MQKPVAMFPSVEGRVKWFDVRRGFGFIVACDGGPDILLHANVLRNYGQSSVAEGTPITVRVQETPRGVQAVEVVDVRPQPVEDPEAQPQDDLPIPDGPLLPARVKWFDKVKGFGFVNVHGRAGDIFVHMDVLRRWGFADLQPGEGVSILIGESDRGEMAVVVKSWDAAVED